jgi:hypothetical protein
MLTSRKRKNEAGSMSEDTGQGTATDGFAPHRDLGGNALSHEDSVDLLVRYVRDRDAQCPSCEYNLRGLREGVCPECGARLRLNVGQRWADPGSLVLVLVPSVLAGGVGLLTLLGIALNGGTDYVVFYGLLITGIASAFIGLKVFAARGRFCSQPESTQGVWIAVT